MMDSIQSFKGYGKVDGAADREFRRKTRRRLIVIGVSAFLLVLIVVGVAVAVVLSRRSSGGPDGDASASSSLTVAQSIKAVCGVTRYPANCYSSLSAAAAANSATASSDPEDLFKLSLRVAADELTRISSLPDALSKGLSDKWASDALRVCKEMFDDAIDHLNDSLSSLRTPAARGEKLLTASKVDDLRSWLSAAVTDQETCLDAFEGVAGDLRGRLATAMRNSTRFTSNSLAIASGILRVLDQLNIPLHRRKLLSAGGPVMPAWVSGAQRRMLLQAAAGPTRPTPNVTVAKDGSGQVETIAAAVAMAPKKSAAAPFVIYVKEGTYVENVVIDKHRWNVVIYGDGMRKSVISGNLNFVEGTRTFFTATFGVDGRGFMAMDLGFENTAGAAKHQAVALRSKSDRAVFYRCAFDGYQDTLYAHSLRQFYRDCEISGTIDFIFGDAAAVFQSCTIRPRQPLPNQQNTITAQGRKDPAENTGIAIQDCVIDAAGVNAPTYLGRPWKNYSTTVVMRTAVDGAVRPEGWLEWVSGTPPPDTIFYGEYQNTGPGAATAGRVKWAGYNPALSDDQAQKYAVEPFIGGSEWIPNTGVAYKLTL